MIWAGTVQHDRLFKRAAFASDIQSVSHEQTKTSRDVSKIEADFQKQLGAILKDMQNDPAKNDIGVLRQKYGDQVNAVIHSAAQNVYLASLKYAEKFNERPIPLNVNDISAIEKAAQKYQESFWIKATGILKRNDSLLNDYGYQERNPLNVQNQLTLLSSALTAGLLSSATIDKVKATIPADERKDVKVVWITALDEKVCPICRPLHGREWQIDDPNILYPGPDDSHHNCRCRLMLSYKGELFES